MCYISSTIAGYLIDKSQKDNAPLSVLQLVKLTYIAHGWHLAVYGTPLISDRIEAWKYGPVMPSLYSLFKGLSLTKDDLVKNFLIEEASCIKPIHRVLLNKVYVKYKYTTGEELTRLMHEEDTPWYAVWNNEKGKDEAIENSLTKEYYSKQMNQEKLDSLSEYSSIESKEEALQFLKSAGIIMDDGSLNPIYG
jgi:uncharacterized phage-associated protein